MSGNRKAAIAVGSLLVADALGYGLLRERYVDLWRRASGTRGWLRPLDCRSGHRAITAALALGEGLAGAVIIGRAVHA